MKHKPSKWGWNRNEYKASKTNINIKDENFIYPIKPCSIKKVDVFYEKDVFGNTIRTIIDFVIESTKLSFHIKFNYNTEIRKSQLFVI